MPFYLCKGKIKNPETGKPTPIEILINGITFGEVEERAYEYFKELSTESKLVSIADAKLREVIDNVGEEKYVFLNASWIGLDDDMVTETVAIVADTVETAIAVFSELTKSFPFKPQINNVKMTKISDRLDNESIQQTAFEQFEQNKSTDE